MYKLLIILLCIMVLNGCSRNDLPIQEQQIITNIFSKSDSPLTEEEAAELDDENLTAYCKDGIFMLGYNEESDYTMTYTPSDGTTVRIEDFCGFLKEKADVRFSYFSSIAADDSGYLYLTDGNETVCLSRDFTEVISLTDSCGYVSDLQHGCDGKVYSISIDYSECAVLIPITPNGADKEGNYTIMADHIEIIDLGEENAAYYLSGDKIYSWNPDEDAEIVMNIGDSGFLYKYICDMKVSSPERIVFRYEKAFVESIQYEIAVYEKAPDIDLSKVKTVTLATTENSTMLIKQIAAFHAENPNIRIKLVDYSEEGYTQMSMDIQTGKLIPDIYYGKTGEAQFRQYVDNELYVDLYTLMENEEVYTKDNLFGSIRRSYENEGALYGVPINIEYMTVIANKDIVGEETVWTPEEMLEISENLPEGVCLFEWDQSSAMYYLLSANTLTFYIDKDNRACHFDSQEFISLLEYIKSLPQTSEQIEVKYDYNDEEERMAVCREGKINAKTLQNTAISDIGSAFVWYGKENTVMIGYPVYDKTEQNGFIMNDKTPVMMIVNDETKDYSWEFFKSCTSNMDSYDIPIWKSVYNELMLERTAFQQYYSASGSVASYVGDDPDFVFNKTEPGELIRWDEEYRNLIYNILDTAGAPVPVGSMYDKIAAIVTEEVSSYLSMGIDSKDCAEKIQSRVNLCINEFLG